MWVSVRSKQKATVGLNKGTAGKGRPKLGATKLAGPKDTRPTLADAGISKKQSARAQKLAMGGEHGGGKRKIGGTNLVPPIQRPTGAGLATTYAPQNPRRSPRAGRSVDATAR
jgi:hypothetical protein